MGNTSIRPGEAKTNQGHLVVEEIKILIEKVNDGIR